LADRISAWIAEAKRRRVFRTVGVYIVAVWGVSSGGVDIAQVLGIPEEVLRYGIFAAIGFIPVVIILAWRFDIGRSGIVRDPQDVLAEERADAAIAEMPTMIGGAEGAGVILVRWTDAAGDQSSLFTDEFFLGRGADCRVRFYDPLVSRKHARIYNDDSTWYIEDLGSRNGTMLGEKKIEREPLSEVNDVRLNDDGPTVRVEWIHPGAETRNAIATHAAGQPTAHIRLTTTDTNTKTR